jgi:phosphoglycerol transferase MdoB-like AlkP superfamily enzyme
MKKNTETTQEKEEKEEKKAEARSRINSVGRFLGAAMVVALLIWYCMHPTYYGDGSFSALFRIRRTYLVMLASAVLITLCVTPNLLPERWNRILSWIWFAASPFAVYFSLYYMNAKKYHINFFTLNRIAVTFTFWFLFLLVIVLLVITGSIRASVVIMALLIGILGIANRFVIMFRGTAISGADLFSIGAAMTVASGYKYQIIWDIYAEAYLTFAICVVSLKLRGFKTMHWKARTLLLLVWMIGSGSFYHICCRTSLLEDNDIRSWGFTHQLRYKQYDMLFTTLLTCFYLAVDKPDGYSIEKVQEIAEDYIDQGDTVADAKDQTQPDVIVIMNESFADYTDVGNGLEFSEDPLPFIHSLTENTIKGTAYASIFGANTPNSEYEFLTGNTMGFLPPTSVGFNLFVRGNMPSLASELKSVGYYTLAMHPYRGTNYRRNIVYPQIGFDTYYDRQNFFGADYIRQYISDQSLCERIIREYQKNKSSGEPLFSYNVTVQNHGGYTRSNSENLDSSIRVLTKWINTTEAQQHANLVHASDEAFQYLVEYFQEQEDPVVIIMFGDHQANIGDATYLHLIGDEENLTAEELMEKYKVPFVCWANYDIEEEVIEKTSLNYLYSILADRLDLPMTGYQKYLLDLSEDIPVLAAGGYWTKDGDFYELKDEESPYFERINDYNILEYNYIFGKDKRCLELFELQDAG